MPGLPRRTQPPCSQPSDIRTAGELPDFSGLPFVVTSFSVSKGARQSWRRVGSSQSYRGPTSPWQTWRRCSKQQRKRISDKGLRTTSTFATPSFGWQGWTRLAEVALRPTGGGTSRGCFRLPPEWCFRARAEKEPQALLLCVAAWSGWGRIGILPTAAAISTPASRRVPRFRSALRSATRPPRLRAHRN